MQANAHCQRHIDLSPLRLLHESDPAGVSCEHSGCDGGPELILLPRPDLDNLGQREGTQMRQPLGGFKRTLDQGDAVLSKLPSSSRPLRVKLAMSEIYDSGSSDVFSRQTILT
jgi:hypothetical protein